MPELPEVETIRRGLDKFVIHQKIQNTTILCDKSFHGTPTSAIITGIRRFGKALIIDLDNQKSLMIHLRMTGQLIFDPKDKAARFAAGHPSENFVDTLPNKQTRVIIELENGTLYFNDQRKFGFIKVLDTKDLRDDPFIKKLAPEPWQMDETVFYEKLQKHKNSPIKAVILDQTVIAGLGNIYADEALFMSKIHPKTKAGTLTKKESANLLKMAAHAMDLSIESGGSTLRDYKKADGTRGDYLDKFAQVFNKQGKPCPICKTPIQKIRVAGRGTHICPHCQTLRPASEIVSMCPAGHEDLARAARSVPEGHAETTSDAKEKGTTND
ncbi:bifunctional DNA-formamidopyrimidine glycosylase/DNA-(apurinic or apyrimidinic site) lyase [Candidatus Saccharibacteria bacterium]|nr:bifunctional DNA-formamidopyrimidine glycosylase/DNA-(apurinic or apyrimidinic site) lyase [Candidatus Saccharibacteria bacterium]